MISKNKWKTESWLEDARSILEWIEQLPSDFPVSILLRHSHRLHSDNQEELLHMQLTSLGCKMANEFGSRIPKKTKSKGLSQRTQ